MDASLLACRGLGSGRVQQAGGRNMQGEKQRKPWLLLLFFNLFFYIFLVTSSGRTERLSLFSP